jgi:hypothetical protein
MKSLTITNNTDVTLGPLDATPGSPTSPFSNVVDGNHCDGVTLAPTQTCTMDYWFTPAKRGLIVGTVTPTFNGIGSTVNLSGKGVAVTVPSFIEFGRAGIGSPPVVKTIIISNTSTIALGPLTVEAENPSDGFEFVDEACTGETLDPGETCTMHYQLNPGGMGDVGGAALLTINDVVYAVGMHGQGAPPGPLDLTLSSVSTSKVALKWTFATKPTRWILVNKVGTRTTITAIGSKNKYSANIFGVKPGTGYCYSVIGDFPLGSGGETAPSNQVCATTPISSLKCVTVSSTQIKLKFKGSIDTLYSIVGPGGRVDGITATQDGTFVSITIGGLPHNKSTCWRVIAVANGKSSAQSKLQCVKTKP